MSLLNPIKNLDDHLAHNRMVTSLGISAGSAFAAAFPMVMSIRLWTGHDLGMSASFLAAAISLIGSMALLFCLKHRDRELDAATIAAGAARLQADPEVAENLSSLLRSQGNRLALSQLRELEVWLGVRQHLRRQGLVIRRHAPRPPLPGRMAVPE